MDSDDLDDLLDGNRAEMEAKFQELETEAEIERMRQEMGDAPPRPKKASAGPGPASEAAPGSAPPTGDDPLSSMKAALESDEEPETYLLVECPHCQARNRMSLTRVRTLTPICGRCKKELAQPKL